MPIDGKKAAKEASEEVGWQAAPEVRLNWRTFSAEPLLLRGLNEQRFLLNT